MTPARYESWTFWIFVCCGFLPALAPEFFLMVGIIVWPCVYIGIAILSMFHSLSSDLPWIVVQSSWFAQLMLVVMVVTVFTALVFGSEALPAMLVNYIAVFFLPGWMLLVGVAVSNEDGSWIAYRQQHYNQIDCCYNYVPKPGFDIPSFEVDTDDNVIRVGQ